MSTTILQILSAFLCFNHHFFGGFGFGVGAFGAVLTLDVVDAAAHNETERRDSSSIIILQIENEQDQRYRAIDERVINRQYQSCRRCCC
jgi:hypothetical protein